MIAAPVQCDVDGIPKRSHYVRVPIAIGRPNEKENGSRGEAVRHGPEARRGFSREENIISHG